MNKRRIGGILDLGQLGVYTQIYGYKDIHLYIYSYSNKIYGRNIYIIIGSYQPYV